MKHTKQSIISKDGISYLIPFILITSCFALWGFANDITNPMVKAFSKIFRMSATDGALVQVAFYGGYFAMAFPAAIFIRKYSYKAGVLLGLGMYAFGAFLFFPAKMTGEYYPFLIAYFILTCGLSFLETSCNPYILSMGTEETATRRLNLAQSFNPMGSLLGMFVAMQFIQAKLHPMGTDERALLNESEFQAIKESDLAVLIAPYLTIGEIDYDKALKLFHQSAHVATDTIRQNAKERRSESQNRLFPDTKTYLYPDTLSRRSDCPVLLCRCTDYVLDIHYSIRNPPVYVTGIWYGRKKCRSTVTAVQHHSNGYFLYQPIYLYLYPALSQRRKITDDPCHLRRYLYIGNYLPAEYLRTVLSGSRFRMHVTDVPHYIRNCPERYGRRCQIWSSRSYYGDPGRLNTASVTGKYH